ncbi:MAG: hypothetical protein AB1349_01750 [Elusimicrobiota bacterium]
MRKTQESKAQIKVGRETGMGVTIADGSMDWSYYVTINGRRYDVTVEQFASGKFNSKVWIWDHNKDRQVQFNKRIEYIVREKVIDKILEKTGR